jgi:hypothetical protein
MTSRQRSVGIAARLSRRRHVREVEQLGGRALGPLAALVVARRGVGLGVACEALDDQGVGTGTELTEG